MPSETENTITYTAAIKLLSNDSEETESGTAETTPSAQPISVSEFELREGYSIGWIANVIVGFEFNYYANAGSIFSKAQEVGLYAGATVILELTPSHGDFSRTWPAVIEKVDPITPEAQARNGRVQLPVG